MTQRQDNRAEDYLAANRRIIAKNMLSEQQATLLTGRDNPLF
jgi:hypothetical protein